jgi:hypothetical protein
VTQSLKERFRFPRFTEHPGPESIRSGFGSHDVQIRRSELACKRDQAPLLRSVYETNDLFRSVVVISSNLFRFNPDGLFDHETGFVLVLRPDLTFRLLGSALRHIVAKLIMMKNSLSLPP